MAYRNKTYICFDALIRLQATTITGLSPAEVREVWEASVKDLFSSSGNK
jgi:hypothetical protein